MKGMSQCMLGSDFTIIQCDLSRSLQPDPCHLGIRQQCPCPESRLERELSAGDRGDPGLSGS